MFLFFCLFVVVVVVVVVSGPWERDHEPEFYGIPQLKLIDEENLFSFKSKRNKAYLRDLRIQSLFLETLQS